MKKIITLTALAAFAAAPVFAADKGKSESSDFWEKCDASAALIYQFATASASRGGLDRAGVDVRFSFDMDEFQQLSISLLGANGEKEDALADGVDLKTSEAALLLGYRYNLVLPQGFKAFAGFRAGVSAVHYEIDSGKHNGWRDLKTDSCFAFAYSAEAGLSYDITKHWAVQIGYQYYGNTQELGGGSERFRDQQYHTVFAGATYSF